jgi:transposase
MKAKSTRGKKDATQAKRKARLKQARKNTKAGKGRAIDVQSLDHLKQINHHAAGIDLGQQENFVCVPADSVPLGESAVRAFGVFTEEMDAMVEWLRVCQVTAVAMEATGHYWMVVYDKLEAAGLDVTLVEPSSVKSVDGRKSDVLDCQWLQKLHTYGLLSRSFRPDAQIRRLRTLVRHRSTLINSGGDYLRRTQKALVEMNLRLDVIVSDINSQTGLNILDAILNGQRNPKDGSRSERAIYRGIAVRGGAKSGGMAIYAEADGRVRSEDRKGVG